MVFKGCTRCRGDLYVEDDVGFRDLVCLQCGARRAFGSALVDESREEEVTLVRWLYTQRPATMAA